jgi:hypothetical protein
MPNRLPTGGQDAIRRVLLNGGGVSKTLLQVIRDKNGRQGGPAAARADLRFGAGPDGRVFLLNKHHGTIRLLVPDGQGHAVTPPGANAHHGGRTSHALHEHALT